MAATTRLACAVATPPAPRRLCGGAGLPTPPPGTTQRRRPTGLGTCGSGSACSRTSAARRCRSVGGAGGRVGRQLPCLSAGGSIATSLDSSTSEGNSRRGLKPPGDSWVAIALSKVGRGPREHRSGGLRGGREVRMRAGEVCRRDFVSGGGGSTAPPCLPPARAGGPHPSTCGNNLQGKLQPPV